MKKYKKLRKVHLNGEIWKYIPSGGMAKIFPPNQRSGQLCFVNDKEDNHGYMATTPAAVKAYIIGHGHELRGIGRLAKKAK